MLPMHTKHFERFPEVSRLVVNFGLDYPMAVLFLELQSLEETKEGVLYLDFSS